MRRATRLKLASVLTIAASTVLLNAVTATTAQADIDGCQDGYVCLYDKTYAKGAIWLTKTNHHALPSSWDNKVRSVRNQTRRWVCFYSKPDYKGTHQKLVPGQGLAKYNARSMKFTTSTGLC